MKEIKPFKSFDDMMSDLPINERIFETFVKAWNIVNRRGFDTIFVSISGGSDSDIVMDIMYRVDVDKRCDYVYFDTGIEYEATKRHVDYLEEKYNVKIQRERAIKPIPTCCKEFGQPFVSKEVSQFVGALQNHGFKFEDKPYEKLIQQYPGAKSYVGWWCNIKQRGNDKLYCIARNKWLKEFLIENPPWFKISGKCCDYAKKNVSKRFMGFYDLKVMGIRKNEGGQRMTRYKSCFEEHKESYLYMPLFFWKNDDKREYEEFFGLRHSDCYDVYGFVRTGCACCPFGGIREVNKELKKIKQYEPNLYIAVKNIFADSYKYMRMYEDFKQEMDRKYG